jgi:hypothetical protein
MTSRPRSSAERRLAQVSRVVADAVDAVAPAARRALGDDFTPWADGAADLAEAAAPAHGAVLAYLHAPRDAVASAAWNVTALRIAAVSGTLAASFCEGSAAMVGRADAATLDAWADAGIALRAEAGWRGERVAHAFFAATAAGLHALRPEHFVRFGALARHLRPALDEPLMFRALPVEVAHWTVDERSAWLAGAMALSPELAVLLYRDVPAALHALTPRHRAALLDVVRHAAAGASGEDLAAVLPMLGPLATAIPPGARDAALALATVVADAFPAGVPALLRTLARVFEETTPAHAATWTDRGIAVGTRSRAAGVAYFGLASRTSLRVLRASGTAVTLDEVQGGLRKLVHMLSGESAVPRPSGRFQLRPPLEESHESRMVALPAAIDCLDTCEDNARLYRVLATLLSGRREFDTYAVLPDVAAYVRDAERSPVLEDLFLLTDGWRVACRMGARYPGLGADLRWAGARLLDTPASVFDAVLAVALRAEGMRGVAPWLAATASMVLPSLTPLAAPDATAVDALRIAERLVVLFPQDRRDVGPAGLPELVTLLLDADEGYGPPASDGPRIGAGGDDDGEAPPELPADLLEKLELLVDEHLDDAGGTGHAMTAEELERLLEAGLGMQISEASGTIAEQAGLYVTQLLGKRLAAKTDPLPTAGEPPGPRRAATVRVPSTDAAVFLYDEWDHLIGDYRPAWCRLREIDVAGDSGLFFDRALARHATLVPDIRRCFQKVRPEMYRPVRNLEDGEEFDLNAAVEARVEHRARRSPSPKLYTMRTRQERDVATLFLLDMSASTDETAEGSSDRIIDIAKDALVIMASALEEIGDAYAIYGFSGQGRDNVEVYPIKAFGERLGAAARSRIGGIEPRGSTRMGTALRHVLGKMRGLTAPSRHLILLSDGFPQDLDYGTDRQSHVYGIRDTATALREVQAAGVQPFCITVDLAGHDYLREMCDPQQYLIIDQVAALPRELPKIYQRLVRAA